jgi:hypothetical protein
MQARRPRLVVNIGEPIMSLQPGAYSRTLQGLLVSATFFESYDVSTLNVLLPNIQESVGVSESALGLTRIPIGLGLFAAFFERGGPTASVADHCCLPRRGIVIPERDWTCQARANPDC